MVLAGCVGEQRGGLLVQDAGQECAALGRRGWGRAGCYLEAGEAGFAGSGADMDGRGRGLAAPCGLAEEAGDGLGDGGLGPGGLGLGRDGLDC